MHEANADQVAIERCLAGEAEAYAALVREYQDVAFRTAYLVVRESETARDVAQEGFVRAYRNLHRFRAGSAFRPWLLRIVTNLALNEIRGRKRQAGLVERIRQRAPGAEPPADRPVEAAEEQGELWAAINRLPENDRVVLYLRHYLELPEAEIAEVIGKRPGTVKSRLSRASARLREIIEREYPGLVPRHAEQGGSR